MALSSRIMQSAKRRQRRALPVEVDSIEVFVILIEKDVSLIRGFAMSARAWLS